VGFIIQPPLSDLRFSVSVSSLRFQSPSPADELDSHELWSARGMWAKSVDG